MLSTGGPGAPPAPRASEYLDTLPGRLLILSGALMIVLLAVRQFVTLPEIVEIFRKVVSLAFIVAAVWLGVLLFRHNRRLLLWRVRRKLILSYLLLGFVPVVLVAIFALTSGFVLYTNVAAYVFREGFKDFILNQACDILHPDLRNSGGFLETKRIADFAHVFGLPMANHNTGSQVCTYATAQWAASIRDYMTLETITGEGGWMDQVLVLDRPYIEDGFIRVTDKAGLGIELNPDIVRAHLAPGETWWG